MKRRSCLWRSARMVVAIVLSLVGLAASVPGLASAAAIVYPPDLSLLTGDGSLDLLGFLHGAAPASVVITGASGSRSQPVGVGAFSVAVRLDPGKNSLTLLDRTITVFLSGDAAANIPPEFSAPDTHAADNDCTECHAFSKGAATLLEPPPELCARCHDDVLKGKDGKAQAVLHPPAEEGDCLACHAFHGRSIKQLPAAAKRDLCFGCHDDFTDGGKKRMHRPVTQGDCTGCHSPHAAAAEKLLPATGTKLCLLCHADPAKSKDGSEFAVPHPALDDGCPTCHLPHVADATRLLIKPTVELCADCHDPFPEEEGGKELVRHSPVEEGECASCHAVHGSELEKLLVASGKALCAQCHDDPAQTPDGEEWSAPHPALDDGCPTCHQPHVAPAAGMLNKEQAALCFDCHDAFIPPVGGSFHLPVAQGSCSSCHAPHGSSVTKLLLAPPERELCLTCHKDPTLAPEGDEWSVPHPALEDGCPACHLPHVADVPRLLSQPQRALCAECHEDKGLNADGRSWPSPHTPVAAGMCASCHGVHGSPEKALLEKSVFEICETCHTEVHARHRQVEIDTETGQPLSGMVSLPKGFPVRKKDSMLSCVGCHKPHGAMNRMLFDVDEMKLCDSCHPM